ncbi:extracellular solute-binding protein [Paenibacillus thalictri]|uniref:Extracellular solute-binding protein n=1 Tax=Paenibacillus thalictri TaxID=2527873 RepID=A0A4Q9DWA4_9BACL|nr:extracellular solute-binding protein [Paenibacillus thalictri]TBL80615.1 extracellular solute-binding protein [Paenibacillus thalictri]
MKSFKTRTTGIASSALALLVVTAGCAGGGSDAGKPPAAASGASANNPPAAAAGASANKPQEAAKITIYANNGRQDSFPQGSQPERLAEVVGAIKDKTGVEAKVIFPPKGAQSDEKLNVLLSSGEDIDLFLAPNWTDFASRGAIQPINELLDKYGQHIKQAWSKDAWEGVTDKNGKIWGIPRTPSLAVSPVWVRADWLKKLNLSMPKTIDEYEAVLKAFKEKDPDGNGKDDTIALALELDPSKDVAMDRVRRAFAGAFTEPGSGDWLDPGDNKLKWPEQAPGYKDMIAKLADWYAKGYILKESFTNYDPTEVLKTNRVGSWGGWYSRMTIIAPKLGIPEMDYQVASELSGPKGKVQTLAAFSPQVYTISKKSKNPEAVIKFLDWIYADTSNFMTADLGIEGKDWKWADKNTGSYEVLVKDKTYIGELSFGLGVANESKIRTTSPLDQKHSELFAKIGHRLFQQQKADRQQHCLRQKGDRSKGADAWRFKQAAQRRTVQIYYGRPTARGVGQIYRGVEAGRARQAERRHDRAV